MDTAMSNLAFNGMSLFFSLRDLVQPRRPILEEAGVEAGFTLLDYGCGPGGYVGGAAELVGEAGTVYALDVHPLAVRRVQELAQRKGLTNVKTIHSDCQTGLPDGSVDLVLLYDIFHMLNAPEAILAELHRVLKRDGVLSVSDHHMEDGAILSGITGSQLFDLARKGKRTLSFVKASNGTR
ncbi:MAG: class I SAM-dependent methyltransferase [Thermoflexales bacterium]|nr:class I SAM-dependent methyltransferase [Thermoflexales bacterium]